MCDFCHQHGEGKIWYLQAKNYSAALAARAKSTRILKRITTYALEQGARTEENVRRFNKAPKVVRWLLGGYLERSLRKDHHGQVVPLEDLKLLLSDVVTSVVRLPCVCRKGSGGSTDGYCLAITAAPGSWDETCRTLLRTEEAQGRFSPPELLGVETLTTDQTLALLQKFEEEGLVHTLWTFGSPFIGGLCNCDRGSCLAMRYMQTGLEVLAPGEYLAEVDRERCKGCKECVARCPFDAMTYRRERGKARVEPAKCYGCGVCRTVCAKNAITLRSKTSTVALA